MIILGIDPGLATIGYGIISSVKGKHHPIEYGTVRTKPRTLLEHRLEKIYDDIEKIIVRHKIDAVSIEEVFFNTNVTTAIDVCQARGVILLAATKHGIPIYEYTPLQVKQAVVGYGRAEKQQIIYMTKLLLNLAESVKPDDTADALALAICHANTNQSILQR
ncbi:MAG: crossover junction endodeoxyribonuclease RuvC [Clostridiales bacterium GWF2_38_85]|nr:MAG: crossover junction endodeoxyribonuclease RuvC [Clostridiales bacterium GWF2_38_85]HBL83505.1 crossover junction endodeoxyribonuclease RuvC [Clostridiales bacterium]